MSFGAQTSPRGQAAYATGQATVTTNTATAMGAIPVAPGAAYVLRVVTTGNDTAGTEEHAFMHTISVRRPSAGTPVLGTQTATYTHRDRSGSAVSFAVVGNNVEVRFTGIAGRTIVAGFRAYVEDWR